MRVFLSLTLLGMAAGAGPAAAQAPKATAVPAVNAAPAKTAASDKMVCKAIASTGTRFVKHDCRTQAEWDQIAADSRQATQDMTDHSFAAGH